MKTSRRRFLIGTASAGSALVLAGCEPIARQLAERESRRRRPVLLPAPDLPTRLAHRAGFGPTPGQAEDIARQGPQAWVESQLRPDASEPLSLRLRLRRLDIFQFGSEDLLALPEAEVLRQLQQAAILRAVQSPWQLCERLVDFWCDHFAVYARKGRAAFRLSGFLVQAIRRHALGSFEELLRATAHSPAMLAYLDNRLSKKAAPNENYARELLELHTLGVDGGYTQRDVMEVARCFTGWTIEDRFLRPRGTFRFDPDQHDDGAKEVLGHRLPPGGGKTDGDRVLTLLARHPSTARHISLKLCRLFVGEEVPASLARAAEGAFSRSGGRIADVVRTILLSPEFAASGPVLKRPFDFVLGSVRAFGGVTDGGAPIQSHLERMGQPLYQWPMPDGYPMDVASWTTSLLPRWRFASALCRGAIPGTSIDPSATIDSVSGLAPAEAVVGLVIGGLPSGATHPLVSVVGDVLSRTGDARLAAAIALASPEAQWR